MVKKKTSLSKLEGLLFIGGSIETTRFSFDGSTLVFQAFWDSATKHSSSVVWDKPYRFNLVKGVSSGVSP